MWGFCALRIENFTYFDAEHGIYAIFFLLLCSYTNNIGPMKKTFAILASLLAISVFSVRAQEDKQIFNHLAVAPTIGFDGIGAEAITTLTPYVQVHAGIAMMLPYIPVNGSSIKAIPETIDINGNVRQLRNNISAVASLNSVSGNILFDIFPGKTTPFHFTVGLYISDPKLFAVDVDASKVLKQDEYASYYIQLNQNNPQTRISSDAKGHIKADLSYWTVRPYFGIGFGRGLRSDKRVSTTVDLGVVYAGNPKVQSYDYTLSAEGKPVVFTSAMLDNKDKGIIDIVSKIPVLPVVKVNIYIRIF